MNIFKKIKRYKKRTNYLIETLGFYRTIEGFIKRGYYGENQYGIRFIYKGDIWSLNDREFLHQIDIVYINGKSRIVRGGQ